MGDTELEFLLDATVEQSNGGTFGLAMVCGGKLISGMVISHHDWAQGLADVLLRRVGSPALSEGLMDLSRAGSASKAEGSDTRPKYVHLRDAQVESEKFKFWRSNIDDVSSWTLSASR